MPHGGEILDQPKYLLGLFGVHPVASVGHSSHLRVGEKRRDAVQLVVGGDVVRLAAPDEQRGLQEGLGVGDFLTDGGQPGR